MKSDIIGEKQLTYDSVVRDCPECKKPIVIEIDFDEWGVKVRKAE